MSKGAEILIVGFIAANSSMLANTQLKGSGLLAVASQHRQHHLWVWLNCLLALQ